MQVIRRILVIINDNMIFLPDTWLLDFWPCSKPGNGWKSFINEVTVSLYHSRPVKYLNIISSIYLFIFIPFIVLIVTNFWEFLIFTSWKNTTLALSCKSLNPWYLHVNILWLWHHILDRWLYFPSLYSRVYVMFLLLVIKNFKWRNKRQLFPQIGFHNDNKIIVWYLSNTGI